MRCRPAARTRDMQERCGTWNSGSVRFDWRHMIDMMILDGHSKAAGTKEEGANPRGGLRSTPQRFQIENPARTDDRGLPLGFVRTGGKVSNSRAFLLLVRSATGLDLPLGKLRMMLS